MSGLLRPDGWQPNARGLLSKLGLQSNANGEKLTDSFGDSEAQYHGIDVEAQQGMVQQAKTRRKLLGAGVLILAASAAAAYGMLPDDFSFGWDDELSLAKLALPPPIPSPPTPTHPPPPTPHPPKPTHPPPPQPKPPKHASMALFEAEENTDDIELAKLALPPPIPSPPTPVHPPPPTPHPPKPVHPPPPSPKPPKVKTMLFEQEGGQTEDDVRASQALGDDEQEENEEDAMVNNEAEGLEDDDLDTEELMELKKKKKKLAWPPPSPAPPVGFGEKLSLAQVADTEDDEDDEEEDEGILSAISDWLDMHKKKKKKKKKSDAPPPPAPSPPARR